MPPRYETPHTVTNVGPEEGATPAIPDVDAFLAENQLTGLASTPFLAHGEQVPLRTALGPNGCPYFAISLAALAKNLKILPPEQRAAIMQAQITETAAAAKDIPVSPTQKKT